MMYPGRAAVLCPLASTEEDQDQPLAMPEDAWCVLGFTSAAPSAISTISRVFAVVRFREDRRLALASPEFFAGAPWMLAEVVVAFCKIPVDCRLGLIQRRVIAVVNDGAGHAAEDGFNDVE